MPRPESPFELICETTREQLPDHWVEEFGRYCWFYVAGLREVARLANTRTLQAIKDCRSHALRAVPQAWKDAMPEGEFGVFSPGQIVKAKQFEPIRFDKALLVVLALEEFARMSGADIDIYDFVEIRPSVFQIENLDNTGFQQLKDGGHLPELKREIIYPFNDDALFKQVFAGFATMEHIIDGILNVSNNNGINIGANNRVFVDRTDNRNLVGQKRPADFQVAFLNIKGVPPCSAHNKRMMRGTSIL